MNSQEALPYLPELLLFLLLAGVLIPLLERLRVNPVLGFLAVGAAVGPYGLGSMADHRAWAAHLSFSRPEGVQALAQLGVLFLMFTIGLELSVERLWAMRRWVFGAGGLQVILSALPIFGVALAWGNPPEAAVLLGVSLAFSSTAVVMQLLSQRRELGSPLGQGAFSILLFQDLAVAPLLVLVTILAEATDQNFVLLLALAGVKGGATLVLIYLLGRRLVRPLFHHLAGVRSTDTFVALTLLSSLGVAALTWLAGLSLAMGALLAGLILSETEFRHEIEVTIEPFKGLLMGLFFMSVGMGIDLGLLVTSPVAPLLLGVGLMGTKAVVTGLVMRGFRLPCGRAVEGALLLAQGGEFAFIVIGMAALADLVDRAVAQQTMLAVGFSMLATPLLATLGKRLGDLLDRRCEATGHELTPGWLEGLSGHVLIAGYGRVGELVGQLLALQGIPYLAVEKDPKLVAMHRSRGEPIVFGDGSRPELLRRLRLERALAVVLTMDQPAAALHAVRGIRAIDPAVRVLSRARDERHALALRQAGATAVAPETLESGLQLAGFVLEAVGMPADAAARLLELERERRILAFRAP